MADTTDLRHMVMSFRVSELQVLLGFAGRNKSGRKQELVTRALSLVEKGCSTPIQIKIRELYRRRFPPKHASPSRPVKSPSHSQNVSSPPHSSSLSAGYNPYSSGTTLGSSHNNQVPIHPDVRFKRLPFYDNLGELMKPSSLVPRNSARFQESFFVFHLTPQQAQDIAMSRDLRQGKQFEYSVQVQLRFCLLETSCPQEDNFPPSICVRVNGKMATLPNPIPTNKPGIEPKRPSRPVNITQICRISPTVPNHINISWASELGRSYCVAVCLVQKLTSDVLLSRLKQNGLRHPDHTRALIKEKLAHDPDSEIATTSLRVSLMCPLGKMRMMIPSRAVTCNHLQCFDAPTYLQMNEKKPTWICPVCDRTAEFDKLFVDGLFTEIVREAGDHNEIQFSEDGSWSVMKPKEEKGSKETELNVTVHEVGDSPHVKKKEEEDVMCIDLTETDEEDDDDTPQAVSILSNESSSSSSSSSSGESDVTSIVVSSPSVISALPRSTPSHTSSVSPGKGAEAVQSDVKDRSLMEDSAPVLPPVDKSPPRAISRDSVRSDHSSKSVDRTSPPRLTPVKSITPANSDYHPPTIDFSSELDLYSLLDNRTTDIEMSDFFQSLHTSNAAAGSSGTATSASPRADTTRDDDCVPYNFRQSTSSINYCEIDSDCSSPEVISLD